MMNMFNHNKKMMVNILFILLFLSAGLNAQIFTVSDSIVNEQCSKGSIFLNVSGGTAPYTYSWSNGDLTQDINNLVVGSYSVTITDAALNDTVINFKVEQELCKVVFNNVFTPNDDGINDTWSGGNLDKHPNFLLQVFNSWGQKVMEQNSTWQAWDGKAHGIKVPDGTYYYVFLYDKSKSDVIEKGSVTIIR